jgi:hypothetical protein
VGVGEEGDTEARAWIYDDGTQRFRESPVRVEESARDGRQ